MQAVIASVAATIAFGALSVTSVDAADADNGKRLAERWCVSCHLVNGAQQSATTDAPPFSAIARKPDFNAGALALFLLHPHPKMPDMGLGRESAADLTAFIASQRQ
jgi:mono/diheme cytochrome c family protein